MVQSLDDARRRSNRPPGGGGRVPPHNLEAEESLLGAMLLSRDAIVSAVEIQLTGEDFYKPAHGHIFDAVTSIYAQGEPADPVTVADELARAGLLDGVGGSQALTALQLNTPAIGNAGRYARIVEEHALLRRLIGVAGEIAEMGYGVPDDVTAAIDQAEALVFDVAQRRVTDSLAPLRELLERHLDHIEALYERAEDITGVPTGYVDLDQQLAGLQPANLVIVGGRPGTGKALALDTPIATPTGWTTMGELAVGDDVFDEQGQPCRVTAATEVMVGHPCYEVAFDDGSTLIADADHQWLAFDGPEALPEVVTTEKLRPGWRLPPSPHIEADHVENRRDLPQPWVVTAVTPVPTRPVRCIAVDSPSHLYLAGESLIPTHNTSFALGIVANAAVEARTPVLMFSLEMSHLELTQRMLCAAAGVDATRMRSGRLVEADWSKIAYATGKLAEAPVFIDDNPHLTIMEIRAKARRLKSRSGLGLIVIDYLQLMTGRNNAENRQVEVSEISRGLKILARELEVPVIALSQLSRSLEQRADKRPVLADLRESGCMPASTKVQRADNGEQITLAELVLSQQQPLVWSVDDRQRLVPARLTKAFPSGVKPVFELRLASGRSVQASANHPFLTVDGWTRLDALEVGSFIAAPRRLPGPLQAGDGWSDDELGLLAHLLGDGTMGPSCKYATSDEENKRYVEQAARRLFGIEPTSTKQANTWQVWFPSPYRLTHGVNHPMRNWLEPHGLWTSRSWTKFVPPSVFGLDDARIAHFLHHLWATDGSITLGRNGRGRLVRTYYATTSRQLALDVQRLLLRLGVRSSIGRSKKQRAGVPADGVQHYREGFSVQITGAPNQAWFLRIVGCYGARGACVPEALAILDGIKENPNVDLIPCDVAAKVKAAAARAGVTRRQLADQLGEAYGGSYLLGSADRPRGFSRTRLARIAAVVGSQELADIATSDLYWDEIVEIVSVGQQPTFDVTIEGTHNFIADGIVAHNSLEQDADVVIFLYRDEVYNRDSPDRGMAEVIVAKHRNGPTGVTQLAFIDRFARFANQARNV